MFERQPCQGQECRYRILFETSGPQASWPALKFFLDIILCSQHCKPGSDLVKAKWLNHGEAVERILLEDGVFRSEGQKMMFWSGPGPDDSQRQAGLVVKESKQEPGAYFRTGFFRQPATRSATIWDGVEETEITLV